MKVSILQVDRCKPIPGLDASVHAPVRQHLEREPVQGPVQDSQIQDWSKTTAFLGYDEVMDVKPLPHLGLRDRLDCILCQEDSNLLAQDRSIPSCHRGLENGAVLGRSPGELNHVAESNCAREPTRQAGQRKPRFQTPCKWVQRHNRRTCGGAAKGSRAGWYRRQRVRSILAELPGSQRGLARGAWGGTACGVTLNADLEPKTAENPLNWRLP